MNVDDDGINQAQGNKENDLERVQGVNYSNNLISFSKEDFTKEKNLQTNYAHQGKSNRNKIPLNKINNKDDYMNKLNNISNNFKGTERDYTSTSTRDTMSKKTIGNDYSVTRCEVEVGYNSNLNLNEDKENFNTSNTFSTNYLNNTLGRVNNSGSGNLFYVDKNKNSYEDVDVDNFNNNYNYSQTKDNFNPYYLTTHNKIQQNLKIRNSQIIRPEEEGNNKGKSVSVNSSHIHINNLTSHPHTSTNKTKKKVLYKYFNNKDMIPPRLLTEVYFSLIIEESEMEIVQRSLSNPSPIDYFKTIQTDINEKMRAVLIDWLIDVHLKFKLKPETLFLTIDILDKYLSIKYIEQNNLQLLGVTSLWLACKYEEVTIPLIKDCEYITANAYNELQIKQMEVDILKTLSYQITFPSILSFFDILAVNFDFKESDYHLGKYFTELFLLDPRINKYKKSVVASSAAYLVMKLNHSRFPEYNYIKGFIMEDERHMKRCAKEICYLIKHNDNSIFQTVKAKYAADEYENISSSSILDLIKE